jgi:hypothetical protein
MTYRPADGVVEVTADPVGLSAYRRGSPPYVHALRGELILGPLG